jgi:transcriptional regulator with XRE-family HTH domain
MTLAVRNNQVASEQADPAHVQAAANELERAIGSQVRRYRKQFGLTVAELADRAALSSGMLSKIENGNTSPSLATLRALSIALNVPVTALFRQFEEQRDATFVSAGQGHADTTYRLSPGDSLFFDADAPHGPEELVELPVRFLSIITNCPHNA